MPNPHSTRGTMLALAAASAVAAAGPLVIGYDEGASITNDMRRLVDERQRAKGRTFKDRFGAKPARGRVPAMRREKRAAAMAGRKANIRRLQRERR